jgi:hypothetical protein
VSDWFAHMRRGDFAAAWSISDAILAEHAGVSCTHLPRHEQWIWDGTPLDGKRVLIRCYHGLGDTIQFARFFPRVADIAAEVTVWAQPSLIPLLETMDPRVRYLPLHDGAPEGTYDVEVESMELGHVFRATLETLPGPAFRRIGSEAQRLRETRHVPASVSLCACEPLSRRAGIVWRAGDWDPQRSIPIDLLDPLFDLPNLTFYSLQRGETDPRLIALEGVDDPLQTARLMLTLDLVISVDTFPAHLAGSLGVPVFTLLPYACDWRWMEGREDSPWYPSMRLFRQPRPGDWEAVVDAVRYAIAMSDESKKNVSDSLHDWGIDVDKFKERAKESLDTAKGDLSEITGTLRQTLVQAKDVVLGLQRGGSPAAAELKAGFERAWQEIEGAFRSAREKATAPKAEETAAASEPEPEPPSEQEPPSPS